MNRTAHHPLTLVYESYTATPFRFLIWICWIALNLGGGWFTYSSSAQSFYLLTQDGKLAHTFLQAGNTTTPVEVRGIVAGETLVALDVRPQNQRLYALGVNASADTMTLYHLSPETSVAAPVRRVSVALRKPNVFEQVDLPETRFDIDFDPATDRLRVVSESGLNFRLNPNTGEIIDGDLSNSAAYGPNPDASINGEGTGVGGAAYTNNRPNNGGIATLYTLDSASNSLFIQAPPDSGTQISGKAVMANGSVLDLSHVGFDLPPFVDAETSNSPVESGTGFFVAQVGGQTGLYRIDLATAEAVLLHTIDMPVRGFAIRTLLNAAIAIGDEGTKLLRFDPMKPGVVNTVPVMFQVGGDRLIAIDSRPLTGQLFGLAINSSGFATLYLIDPETGEATLPGFHGSVYLTDVEGNRVLLPHPNFPDPLAHGYGFDFDPTSDQIRIVTSTGLNFRVDPNTGNTIDGDPNNTFPSPNPDGQINGAAVAAVAAAHTNSFGQDLSAPVGTALYTIDHFSRSLLIQNPPNAGTMVAPVALLLSDLQTNISFDIVSVATAAAPGGSTKDVGWLATGRVPRFGRRDILYHIDLTTGYDRFFGSIGSGEFGVDGLVVWAAPLQLTPDTFFRSGYEMRVHPLANDRIPGDFVITGVSDGAISIEGRTLVVPPAYSGTFEYEVSNGIATGSGEVGFFESSVLPTQPRKYGALLYKAGQPVGTANVMLSPSGMATVRLRTNEGNATVKLRFSDTNGGVTTKLGTLTLEMNNQGIWSLSLQTPDGEVSGGFRQSQSETTSVTYNMALESVDSTILGGGFAVARVARNAVVKLSGVLPDGHPFTASTFVAFNSSLSFYIPAIKGTKPRGSIGGELYLVDSNATEIAGELKWTKPPQLPRRKGMHPDGVAASVIVNGNIEDGTLIAAGDGTLILKGGDLNSPETNNFALGEGGIPPTPRGSLQAWSASQKRGAFTAKVQIPGVSKLSKGRGVYLKKAKRAWGYFSGITQGGRIELTLP